MPAGKVHAQVHRNCAADGAFGKPGGQRAVLRLQFGPAVGEHGLNFGGRKRTQPVNDGAGADGGQQFLRVLCQQDERGVLGRLFKQLEQAVGRFFHEGRVGEDGEGAARFHRRAIIGDVDRLPHLAQLDEQLGRVGRDDEHVGMCLDEDARLALIRFAHVVAGGNGLSTSSSRLRDSPMRVQLEQMPQKSGRPSVSGGLRQFTACASITASVYFPAPRGPARISECGKRPARMLSRRCVTVAELPRKS